MKVLPYSMGKCGKLGQAGWFRAGWRVQRKGDSREEPGGVDGWRLDTALIDRSSLGVHLFICRGGDGLEERKVYDGQVTFEGRIREHSGTPQKVD